MIPIILGAIALGTAGVGIKKGIDAKEDYDLAKMHNEDAQKIAVNAQKSVEDNRKKTKTELERLGSKKIDILATTINEFVVNYGRIKDMDLNESDGISELKNFNPDSVDFAKLEKASFEACNMIAGGLAAIDGSVLLACGAYEIVMRNLFGHVVVETTSAALGSLGSVAATNATLAWLGGSALTAGGLSVAGGATALGAGALTAGGLGVAGGATALGGSALTAGGLSAAALGGAALGGVALGPVMALGGFALASQAEKAYYESRENEDKAKEYAAKCKLLNTNLKIMKKRAIEIYDILFKLDDIFKPLLKNMNSAIDELCSNPNMDRNTKRRLLAQKVYPCVKTAKAIKAIIDTSIIDEKGDIVKSAETNIATAQKFITANS